MARRSYVDRVYWTEGEGLVQIKKWLREGLFDKQIAEQIGISNTTLSMWKTRYPTFETVFKKARGVACLELVNATFKSAKGYYVQEQMLDNKGRKRVIRKWIPANTSAQIFLLKNWLPSEYKDKWDIDLKRTLPVVITGDDEIAD